MPEYKHITRNKRHVILTCFPVDFLRNVALKQKIFFIESLFPLAIAPLFK